MLTLSQAVTANEDHLIIIVISVVSSQALASSIMQQLPTLQSKSKHCIASKTYFALLLERVNFTQRLSQ